MPGTHWAPNPRQCSEIPAHYRRLPGCPGNTCQTPVPPQFTGGKPPHYRAHMHIAGDVASHCRGITGASPDITGDVASHYRGVLPGHHHITGDIASHHRRNTGVIAGHHAPGHTCITLHGTPGKVHARTCRGYIEIVHGAHSKEGMVHDPVSLATLLEKVVFDIITRFER